MKKVQILTTHYGENATTPHSPAGPVVKIDGNFVTYIDWQKNEVAVDMTTTRKVCVAYDNDMLIETNQYGLAEVELPTWLEPTEWVARITEFKWLWGFGGKEFPESWQRDMIGFSSAEKYVFCKLLNQQSFRSEFRKSLRDQVVAWLQTPREERKWGRPLSQKQFRSLFTIYDQREAERIDKRLYSNRGW